MPHKQATNSKVTFEKHHLLALGILASADRVFVNKQADQHLMSFRKIHLRIAFYFSYVLFMSQH